MQSEDILEARWTKEEKGAVVRNAPKMCQGQDHKERNPAIETGLACWTKDNSQKGQGPKKNGHAREVMTATSEPQLEGWTAGGKVFVDEEGQMPIAAAESARANRGVETINDSRAPCHIAQEEAFVSGVGQEPVTDNIMQREDIPEARWTKDDSLKGLSLTELARSLSQRQKVCARMGESRRRSTTQRPPGT